MKKHTKILPVIVLLLGVCFIAMADRGTFGKKSNVSLNIDIKPYTSLRNNIHFNLKSGLQYKGNLLLNRKKVCDAIVEDVLIKYKKGNTVYLIPYKQKVLIPKYSSQDGSKLTINLGK